MICDTGLTWTGFIELCIFLEDWLMSIWRGLLQVPPISFFLYDDFNQEHVWRSWDDWCNWRRQWRWPWAFWGRGQWMWGMVSLDLDPTTLRRILERYRAWISEIRRSTTTTCVQVRILGNSLFLFFQEVIVGQSLIGFLDKIHFGTLLVSHANFNSWRGSFCFCSYLLLTAMLKRFVEITLSIFVEMSMLCIKQKKRQRGPSMPSMVDSMQVCNCNRFVVNRWKERSSLFNTVLWSTGSQLFVGFSLGAVVNAARLAIFCMSLKTLVVS